MSSPLFYQQLEYIRTPTNALSVAKETNVVFILQYYIIMRSVSPIILL